VLSQVIGLFNGDDYEPEALPADSLQTFVWWAAALPSAVRPPSLIRLADDDGTPVRIRWHQLL